MKQEDPFLLRPGMGVDLVFNLDSLSPVTKQSIIFDINEKNKTIVVAQPGIKILKNSNYNQIHISSMVKKEFSSKIRLGYSCTLVEIIKNYRLSNNENTEAVVLKYSLPAEEINIRSAYRLQPDNIFEVYGKMVIYNEMFYSGRHFKFYDISVTGIGILIPRTIQKERNRLVDIKPDVKGKVGVLLKNGEDSDSVWTIESRFNVVRVNANYNQLSCFAGLSIIDLNQDSEEILNRFIHQAQLYKIRKDSRFD